MAMTAAPLQDSPLATRRGVAILSYHPTLHRLRVMRSGKCPKCGSSNVRTDASRRVLGQASQLPLGGFNAPAPLTHYVCAGCGYMETYVKREKDLQKIAARWPLATEMPWELG